MIPKGKTPEEISAYFREKGSKNKPSAFKDKAIAKKAAQIRWAKYREAKNEKG